MESELLRSMLTCLASTSHLAVELFFMIQSDSEESDDDIDSSNAYDMSLLVAFTDMLTTMEHHFWARETSSACIATSVCIESAWRSMMLSSCSVLWCLEHHRNNSAIHKAPVRLPVQQMGRERHLRMRSPKANPLGKEPPKLAPGRCRRAQRSHDPPPLPRVREALSSSRCAFRTAAAKGVGRGAAGWPHARSCSGTALLLPALPRRVPFICTAAPPKDRTSYSELQCPLKGERDDAMESQM
ncbi:hypothetical protein UY3_06292 [Chelonia mydas]|uniref:Uncharacterized protein n=1 Tax=Chelonia mydas TaxID=8469 RepID=M7C7H8_CHEMY|nr:hypothetical protein UY3_06292 [Chelonia mydas]